MIDDRYTLSRCSIPSGGRLASTSSGSAWFEVAALDPERFLGLRAPINLRGAGSSGARRPSARRARGRSLTGCCPAEDDAPHTGVPIVISPVHRQAR